MKRFCRVLVFLAGLLLLCAMPLSVFAENGDEATPDESFSLYNSNYDPVSGKLTVDLNFEMAKRGWVDVSPTMAEAAERNASFYLDAGRIKLYFTPDAVRKCVENGKIGHFLIEDLSPVEDGAAETAAGTEYQEDGEIPLKRYRISLGETVFEPGSVRVSIRVVPDHAELLEVFLLDGEERTAIPSAYADKQVSFYPDDIGDFLIVEREAEAGTPKILYLAFLMLFCVIAASVVLVVLIKTGRLQKMLPGMFLKV